MATIEIPNVRQESTVLMPTTLKDNGVAVDWSGLQNIKAYMYSDAQRVIAGKCDVEVDGEDATVLKVTYAATRPQYLGVNSLLVRCKYHGREKSYDVPVLNFVERTAQATGVTTLDDPVIDVEIEVDEVSTSLLDGAIAAALDAAVKAEEAASLVPLQVLEDCVEATENAETAAAAASAAGITSVQASVADNEPGTPSVDAALLNKVLSLVFHHLKGAKGDTGATPNISVGTVTTGAPGTPVVITMTGTAAAPVLNITIPQGLKGEKGDQGNTGSSVEFPYELVNNLTTNDPTKGLSAAQGVVLDGKISQLDQEGLGLLNLTHLVDAGAIVMENGSISTSTGANSTSGATIRTKDAFRTPDTIAAPDGYVVARIFYYNSWTDASNFSFDTTAQINAKGGKLNKAKPYCRVTFNAAAGGNITWPAFVDSIYLVSRKITSLQNRVFGDTEFSLVGYINASTGAYVPGSSAWRSTDFIPVNEGDKIDIYSSAAGSVDAAFYKDDKTFLSAVAGTAVGTKTVTAPVGARWYRCANVATCPAPYTNVKSIVYERLVAALNKAAPAPTPTPTPVKLFDSINKPIVFNGKTMRAFGDSITWGLSSPNLTPAGDDRYISRFAAHVGAVLNIHAESGATLTTGNGNLPSIYTKIASISSAADIIWIMGGINDWQEEVSIGDFDDAGTTTVYGAMNAICAYIKQTWPNAVVIFVTPIPTTSLTVFGETHPDNLDEYRKAIQEVAAANGFNVVNGADLGLPDEQSDFGDFMYAPTDCLHPTLAGHAMLARSLAGKLL